MVAHEHHRSIEFLQQFEPAGPWCLTAILISQRSTRTRTFAPGEEEEVLAWLEEHGKTCNLYFTANPVRGRLSQKAEKTEILEVRRLHVDVDPRAGEDFASEQRRIRELLTSGLPANIPRPTWIIASGGGYQAFWELEQPISLDGTIESADEAALYNKSLELALGGDHCHNVDRVMRLPGTVNWPNEKKRKAGRKPVLATISRHEDLRHSLSAFSKAVAVQGPVSSGFSRPAAAPSNIRRLDSVEELGEGVPNKCKVVIVQGMDPDEPTKFSSRSEWVWYVVCELVRSGVPDETIFSVITDPSFAISGHILAQRSGVERYAMRQIERAKEHAVDPWLVRMNDRHAVISDIGGRCRVITEVADPVLGRTRLSAQTFDDFRNRYLNEQVEVGQNRAGDPIYKPVGDWWLRHPKRRQYDTIVFCPGREVEGAYNLWRGYGCEPAPGKCDLFLAHLRDVLCAGVEEHYNYLLRWMASAVQKPDRPGQVAVVLKGKMGAGKGTFARHFGALFGRHYLHLSDPKHLLGNFNVHLRDAVLLFADEAFYAGDKKHESLLKTLITEDTLVVEGKGRDAEVSANCVHLIVASNEDWAVPAAIGDRRFFILDVSGERAGDSEYFARLEDEMSSGGRSALLHYLLGMDLAGWDVRTRPKTDALRSEQHNSLTVEQDWWLSKLRDGRLLSYEEGWPNDVVCAAMLEDFAVSVRRFGARTRMSALRMQQFLDRMVPGLKKVQTWATRTYQDATGREVSVSRPYIYRMATLERCRAHWDLTMEQLGTWEQFEEEKAPDYRGM